MSYIFPALLFSGICMFFNGYTIRYLHLSKLIRDLHNQPNKSGDLKNQIITFKLRLKFVKWIQFFSVISLLLATLSIFIGFLGYYNIARLLFIISILIFLLSLIISALEIRISVVAIDISLKNKGGHLCK